MAKASLIEHLTSNQQKPMLDIILATNDYNFLRSSDVFINFIINEINDKKLKNLLNITQQLLRCKMENILDITTVKNSVESIIEEELVDKDSIIKEIEENYRFDNYNIDEKNKRLILETLLTITKNSFLWKNHNDLINKLYDFGNDGIGTVKERTENFIDYIKLLYNHTNNINNQEDNSVEVSLQDKQQFGSLFQKTFMREKDPSIILSTGIKTFNKFLSSKGGFLPGNLYLIIGRTQSFKSGFLLYITKWIRQYNGHKFDFLLNRGITPTVLHISLENSIEQDFARFYYMVLNEEMKDSNTQQEAIAKFNKAYYGLDSSIDIRFMHKRTNTLTINEIEYKIKELEGQNRKVIALVIDYIAVLKPEKVGFNLENRFLLKNLVQKLRDLSLDLKIPIITAQHTNREADAKHTEEKMKGTVNIVRTFDSHLIAESKDLDRSTDFLMFIQPEQSPIDKKMYLTFLRTKCREAPSNVNYFVHELTNGFLLEEDANLNTTLSKKEIETVKTDQNLSSMQMPIQTGNRGSSHFNMLLNNSHIFKPIEFDNKEIIIDKKDTFTL